jgi:hypothetical protein
MPLRTGPNRSHFPFVKRLHLHLLDRGVIARAGIDRDARNQHRDLQTLERGRLPHDVFRDRSSPALRSTSTIVLASA